MVKPRILVCDDNGRRAEKWAESMRNVPAVADAFEIVRVSEIDFGEMFKALRKRQVSARHMGAAAPWEEAEQLSVLDQAAAVIVDYDLTPSDYTELDAEEDWIKELAGSFGNVFAYLARVFSGVGYTVVVNQDFPVPTFDLTMTRFQYSAADLNVTADDLKNPGLWSGAVVPDDPQRPPFRPWHWPSLVQQIGRLESLAAEVDLEANVFETLGLNSAGALNGFAVEQLEALGLESRDKPTLTFNDLVEIERYGNLPGDNGRTDEQKRRIAASATVRWLDRTVLVAQNVLIDAPHLVTRRPGLTMKPVDEWSRFAELNDHGAVADMFDGSDEMPALSPASAWIGRPVWIWQQIPVVSSGSAGQLVFCEDTSTFCRYADATSFESSVPGPIRQRFVRDLAENEIDTKIEYDPVLRLL